MRRGCLHDGSPQERSRAAGRRGYGESSSVALNADKELFARHITVRADSGVVQLGGYVWTQPELEDAIRIAGLVPGVTKVVDRMEVDRSGLSDSAVTR